MRAQQRHESFVAWCDLSSGALVCGGVVLAQHTTLLKVPYPDPAGAVGLSVWLVAALCNTQTVNLFAGCMGLHGAVLPVLTACEALHA